MEEPTGPGQSEWSDQQYARALTMWAALLEVASGCGILLAAAALCCVVAALTVWREMFPPEMTGAQLGEMLWLMRFLGPIGLGFGIALNITGIRRIRQALKDRSYKPNGKP